MKKSKEYIQELYKEVQKGKTIRDLAKEIGKGKETVRQWFIKEGFDTSLHKNKPKFDTNYFSKINSQAKAYYLGLIYADGCIVYKDYNISIFLQQEDAYIIEQFKQELQSTNKTIIRLGEGNIKTKHGISLCSKQMYNDLLNLGLIPNKSQDGLHFPKIKNQYYSSFILGFFDGDGSISISQRFYKGNRNGINRKFKLVCTDKSFLEEIIKIFCNNNISVGKLTCSNNYSADNPRITPLYSLEYWRINDLNNIYNYLYLNYKKSLKRKKEKMSISMLTVRELNNLKVI